MVSDDLYLTVPSYFRCPISLDVMKSPVSLCTGVTYDRTSIQRWLDAGNNTCPATMQLLHNKDLIPNHTLQRLIKIWSDSVLTQPHNSSSLTYDQASELIHHLQTDLLKLHKHSLIIQNLSKLTSFAHQSEENGRYLAVIAARILPLLVSFMGNVRDLKLLEQIVLFCVALIKNVVKIDLTSTIELVNCDFKSSIILGLKRGRLGLRIAIAKFLDLMTTHFCLSFSISEDDEIYIEVLRLITVSNWDSEAVDASLNLLNRNRVMMVRAGGVKVLAAGLAEVEISAALTEKVLKLLEVVSGCREGRNEICGNRVCVQAIVKKVLKVSKAATEHAVTVLWSICCLFGDKRAAGAVVESNGVAKILVVLQSNCSPAVRQMCGDLLRVLRCSDKSCCVSWYDTKTTHIMPF